MDVAVMDASLIVDMLDKPGTAQAVARLVGADPELLAPPHVRLEAISALRRNAAAGLYAEETEDPAWRVNAVAAFPIDLIPEAPLLPRIWELRHNLTVYDAAYVALAEAYECAVLSTDRKLSRTPNLPVPVITF